jgi:alpha-galactosidase
MLRLLAPDRAVQLDPMLWHPQDSDENVAVHLINCLVSVPMVSIELDKYPQSHLDLIRYWISFYNEHRDTIVHSEFRPTLSLGHVPMIHFVGSTETIIGLYDDIPVRLESAMTTVWILNASTRPYLELVSDGHKMSYEVTTHDKFGRIVSRQQVSLPAAQLAVEVGGSIELNPR